MKNMIDEQQRISSMKMIEDELRKRGELWKTFCIHLVNSKREV